MDLFLFFQANEKVAFVPFSEAWREKHHLFVKWKLCEAKVHDSFL